MQKPTLAPHIDPTAGGARRRFLGAASACVAAPWLSACAGPAPVRLGFIGGLTGPTADLGVAGRDGAMLALEQHHRSASGQRFELVEFDDRQRPDDLEALAGAVQAAGVQALIGPMTSSVAARWIPLANRHGWLTLSPTATSTDFSGQDDHFFRVCATAKDYATASAEHHMARHGWRRFALIRDDSNGVYTRSWTDHFRAAVQRGGGQVLAPVVYRSTGPGQPFSPLVQQALAGGPEALVVVASAFDTAQLLQVLRRTGSALPVVTAEWAATEQLPELGGRAVEGLRVAQYFDRDSQQPAYRRFAEAFEQRFARRPGFAEVAAFDAARVLLQAWPQRRRSQEALRDTLKRIGHFEGLQQAVAFDAYGEAQRTLFITRVVNGRYVVES